MIVNIFVEFIFCLNKTCLFSTKSTTKFRRAGVTGHVCDQPKMNCNRVTVLKCMLIAKSLQ